MKIRKLLFTIVFAALIPLAAGAVVSTGYYVTLNGKVGEELKDAIHRLTAQHTRLSYSSLWYYYPETDPLPENPDRVWDMYSNIEYFFPAQRGNSVSGMNREHSFPKSWWGSSSSVDAYSDLHHLIPTDATANSKRSNHPFGEVLTEDWNNGVSRRGTPMPGQGGGSTTVFEPNDEYKGDFARIYFYMVSCYQDYTWKNTYMLSNTDWKTLNQWSIDLLLKWARQDPVSEKEINRNDAIFRFQNNRNPFVDNPELMEYIWGDKIGYAFNDTTYIPTPDPDNAPELLTPTQGTILDFGEVALGTTATLNLYVRGQYLTNDLSLRLYRYQYKMFDLSTTSITAEQANNEDGFMLQISYTPTQLGDHKAKLLFSEGGMTGTVGVELQAHCVEPHLLGDLNLDGAVDIADLNIMINATLNGDAPEDYLISPDLNNDGNIDIADLNLIINILLGAQ